MKSKSKTKKSAENQQVLADVVQRVMAGEILYTHGMTVDETLGVMLGLIDKNKADRTEVQK